MYGHERSPVGGERWFVLGLLCLIVVGFGAELFSEFTPAKLSVVFIVLAMPVLIAVHELGHAAMGRLLGWKICAIVVGYGRPILRFRIGTVPVEIRIFPMGGHVVPAPTRLRAPRLENALIYAAGPGAELLVALAIALAIGSEALLTRTTSPAMIAAQSVVALIVFDLFSNLVPIPFQSEGRVAWTDGLGVLKSPFLPAWHFRRALTVPWVVRADEADDAWARVAVFREGVAAQPNNPFMRLHLSSALRAAGDPLAAHAERMRALESGELPSEVVAELARSA
jgi:hypothetical protein